MWDRTFGVEVKNYIEQRGPSHVTVTEKKAPTDESIKLLKEMEERVEKKIFSTLPVNNNLFNGKLVFLQDMAWDRGIIKIKYKLNNRENIVEVIIDEFKIEIEEVVNKIVKSLSEDIAKNILTEVFTEFHGNMEFRDFLNKRAHR